MSDKTRKEHTVQLNIIRKIEVNDCDITFYFQGSDHPFSAVEFEEGSPTRSQLESISDAILVGHTDVKLKDQFKAILVKPVVSSDHLEHTTLTDLKAQQLADCVADTISELESKVEMFKKMSQDWEVRAIEKKQELQVNNQLLEQANTLVNMFSCPAHGRCVPYACEIVTAYQWYARQGKYRVYYNSARKAWVVDTFAHPFWLESTSFGEKRVDKFDTFEDALMACIGYDPTAINGLDDHKT